MNKKNNSETTLGKQKRFIGIFAILVIVIAVLCVVLPRVFKEEEHTISLLNEKGDSVFYSVSDYTGVNITARIENMAAGKEKNIWNVKKGDGINTAYTFNLDGAKVSYRPYIFDEIPLEKLSRVTVKNASGAISAYSYEGGYIIEGAEKNLYNQQKLAELLLQARYMLAVQYVENPGKAADYGADESNCKAVVEVLDKDGNSHKIFVGNEVMNGSGYYMKNAEKEHIYIMDSGASVFFDDLVSFLSPTVINPIDEHQRNYIEKFAFAKNGVPFFACEILPEEQQKGIYANQLHRMTYPEEEHVLNTTTIYEMFSQIGALSGVAVAEYGVSESENAQEIFAYYGFDNAVADISFSFGGNNYIISVGKAVENDGVVYNYVYSAYQDTVVLVPASSMNFLEYELVDLYQTNVFQYNINEVSEIELKYGEKNYKFGLSGEGKELSVTELNSAKAMDVPSFRQLYISLLNVTIGGYSAVEGTGSEMLKHELTYTVTLKDGSRLIYEFYSESTMSCYMIVDGKGGFKTDRKWIDTIIKHSEMLINGEIIESTI